MASTGTGKTLANGRIMYALAPPESGARFTIALGLRTLTLQTGEVYRQRMGLGSDDLAVLVGGGRSRELFDLGLEDQKEQKKAEDQGRESSQPLLAEGSYVHYDGALDDSPLAEWMSHTRGAHKLISAPVLTCTIDHLMPATESLRGGHQIAPMLRLMTSDLVLDEPDDFGPEDLPALTRLVNWAGLLGAKVLLSSATLPPSLVLGLFKAYLKGREVFQDHRGNPGTPINVCTAWFDEFECQAHQYNQATDFMDDHLKWVEKRTAKLEEGAERRRKAKIIDMGVNPGLNDDDLWDGFSRILVDNSCQLHASHHTLDEESDKRISFGLIRMANINPLVEVAQKIIQRGLPDDHRLHLVCYHSQHPLLVRSQIEAELDRTLDRHNPKQILLTSEVRKTLVHSEEKNHLFIVLATAVAEIGRDHDYDWAIVEPSSMRSIIQLAGRVRRHRPGEVGRPNIHLLNTNIRHLRQKKPGFSRPGFETKGLELESHSLIDLLTEEQLAQIDSRPRIRERGEPQPHLNLVDLEHAHLREVMLNTKKPASLWIGSKAHLCADLQRNAPFRKDDTLPKDFALHSDEDADEDHFVQIEKDGTPTPADKQKHDITLTKADNVSFWCNVDYLDQVKRLAERLDIEPAECARRYGTLSLPTRLSTQGWDYNPVLGFSIHK